MYTFDRAQGPNASNPGEAHLGRLTWEGPETLRGTILLAEPDSREQARLAELLVRAGHTVMLAHSGPDAARLARKHLPDVLITELTLPRKSGLDLIETIKQDPATCGIAVIVTSASTPYLLPSERRRTAAALVKPSPTDELLAAIQEALIVGRARLQAMDESNAKLLTTAG